MAKISEVVFTALFKEVYEKCFGHSLTSPLSETDSRLLSNSIQEQTGLVIGVKSLRNYSLFVLNVSEGKKENPSVATLDTLARYVLDAPYSDEIQRKKNESHYPYWFEYKSALVKRTPHNNNSGFVERKVLWIAVFVVLLMVSIFFVIKQILQQEDNSFFVENFDSVMEDSLNTRGWSIKNQDTLHWNRRSAKPGHLTLFTLRGDNWPDSKGPSKIKNVIVKRVDAECFTTEIHLSNFFPRVNWQQAGLLLSEDSSFIIKTLRLSVSYNDFFGGYKKDPEVIIQAVSSSENGNQNKPEEIAHLPIFTVEPGNETLVERNLSKTSLRIEKNGTTFRFLYSTSPTEAFAFQEVAHGNFSIQPKFIGLFAIQGLSETENAIPVNFDSFSLTTKDCDK